MIKLVFADTETTGLSPLYDKVVEIALATQNEDGGIITFQRYIRYEQYPADFKQAFEVSGITLDLLEEKGVEPRQAYLDMVAWLKANTGYMIRTNQVILAGHNIAFDKQFLDKFMQDWYINDATDEVYHKVFSSPMIDTMTAYTEALRYGLVPETSSFKLQTLCNKMGVKVDNFHSALDDTIASLHLHKSIWDKMAAKNEQLSLF